MQDLLLKGLHNAILELESNTNKGMHIKNVAYRLAQASEVHPHDSVIRIMNDVFTKRAVQNGDRLVTAEEFNEVKQSLWTLNPKTAINEIFPELVYSNKSDSGLDPVATRIEVQDTVRTIDKSITNADIVNSARQLVVSSLKNAGINYAQTSFEKGMADSYSHDGSPQDGVLMFSASVVTKGGEHTLSIPVVISDSRIMTPDSFAVNGMNYPLTAKGVSDYSIGIKGSETDRFVEDARVFGSAEIRNVPVVDDTAPKIVENGKQRIYNAFREIGVANCQIRFATFSHNEEDGTGVLAYNVHLPFSRDTVQVPVVVDEDFVYSPNSFTSNAGQEYELSRSGIDSFISSAGFVRSTQNIANRLEGDGTPRHVDAQSDEHGLRKAMSVKLAQILEGRGAINPQVYHVTSSSDGDTIAESFVSVFGSSRGECHIAIPVVIKRGEAINPPQHFYGLDGQQYDFSEEGLKAYINTQKEIKPLNKTDFHGEREDVTLAKEDIDLNARAITRQEGFEIGERVIRPADKTMENNVANARSQISKIAQMIGVANTQVYFQNREDTDYGYMLHFGADFQTAYGTKKAQIPVYVIGGEVVQPSVFIGTDSKHYQLTDEGIQEYLAGDEAPRSDLEAEISNKLSILSYDDIRDFLKHAVTSGDSIQVNAAMESISTRFGEETAINCMMDLSSRIVDTQKSNFASQCNSCPFYVAGSDPKAKTATDMCFKFNVPVKKVAYGGHHKNCTLTKVAVKQDEAYDGSIMTSKLKMT